MKTALWTFDFIISLNITDLGMDSLMMIEMKNVVQSTLGKRATITVSSVKDCHTVNQLAAR